MNRDDNARRIAALTRLAIATRERLPAEEKAKTAFFRIYLDDFEHFSTDTYERACRRLETSLDWFPKKHELMEACQAVAKWKAENQKPVRLALPSGDKPLDLDQLKNFRRDVERNIQERHSMPGTGRRR